MTRVGDFAFHQVVVATFVCILCVGACKDEGGDGSAGRTAQRQEAVSREPLEPLQPCAPLDARVIALGRELFSDPRLSGDDAVACSSCHDFARGGADGRVGALGIHGQVGEVNAPTVINAGLNFVQFWDGRAVSLEDQVNGPLNNPAEMGSSWQEALAKIRADPAYRTSFAAAFADGATADNVRRAIADFERTLVAVDSPFDRWLRGDHGAMTAQELEGYALFKGVGCIACHQGRNVGGNMFQHFGVFADYFANRGHVTKADYGRYNVTGSESDRFVFRVPSLRYVAHTAPYFHDGSAATLPEAVQVMARYQLGRTLTNDQVASIVAFLRCLAGPTPASVGG